MGISLHLLRLLGPRKHNESQTPIRTTLTQLRPVSQCRYFRRAVTIACPTPRSTQAVTTVSTIGYGDAANPATAFERAVGIVAMVVGSTAWAYILGSVTALIGTMSQVSGP